MATPNIGTSISDGYQRGLDRMAAWAPSILIPALIMGLTMGGITEAQSHFGASVDFSNLAVDVKQSASDRAVYNLLAVVQAVVLAALGTAALAIFAGAFHRERHGGSAEVPTPAEMGTALVATFQALLPKLWVLIGLQAAGPAAAMVSGALGSIISLVSLVAAVYFGVRWVYASVIVGGGEATGDAAFTRSEEAVTGNFWPTFGTLLVVGLATLAPLGVVAVILIAVLPGAFLSFFIMGTLITFGSLTIWASALESMWAQVEAGDAPPPSDAFGTPTSTYAAEQPPARPAADDENSEDPYA